MKRRSTRSPSLFRAVSPDGKPGVWRRRRWAAVRDAAYGLKGWGVKRKDADGNCTLITINAGMAWSLLDEALTAGWTFHTAPAVVTLEFLEAKFLGKAS